MTSTNDFEKRAQQLMSLVQAFHVSLSQLSDKCAVLRTPDSYGSIFSKPLAELGPASACSKTFPDFSALEHPSLAYAAGIMDGDGCFCLYARKYGDGHLFTPAIMVGMSVKGLRVLKWMQSQFGGNTQTYASKRPNTADRSIWRLHGKAIGPVLKKLLPGLILKKKQAELLLESVELMKSRSPSNQSQLLKLKEEMHRLNATGQPKEAEKVWLTDQLCLDGSLEEFSGTWPRSGMIVCGKLFPLPPLVQDICESASSSSLPTPFESLENSGFGLNLPRQVAAQMLPTPTGEQDAGFLSDANRKSPQLTTVAKLAFLPTPTASRIGQDVTILNATDQRTAPNKLRQAIGRQAHLLPTPTARDYKDTPGMRMEAGGGRMRDDQLPRRVFSEMLPTPRANKRGVPDSHGNTEMWNVAFQTCEGASPQATGGMKLTPEFLCWLQGFPTNWLKPLRDALGTQSYRALPGSSQGRLGSK